ncbi:MAG TPA: hypothetical protein VN461_09740 [Vicinamibacteria bacterium]|jgi:hypothetical protein|nr:hypothetical protein [Vicinamibacteria bacterium]
MGKGRGWEGRGGAGHGRLNIRDLPELGLARARPFPDVTASEHAPGVELEPRRLGGSATLDLIIAIKAGGVHRLRSKNVFREYIRP